MAFRDLLAGQASQAVVTMVAVGFFSQHGHSGGDLSAGGVLGAAQDDAACVADLVVVELAKFFIYTS